MGRPGKYRSKYGNKKTVHGDETFDSKGELRRWAELCLLQKAGEITDLRRQVPVQLTAHGKPICKIVLDYTYVENGQPVYEDHKSPATVTPVFRLKAKLFAAQVGQEIRLTGKGMRQ